MSSSLSKRVDPSIAVLTMSASSTTTPKNMENHRAIRKVSESGVLSLLLPVASG